MKEGKLVMPSEMRHDVERSRNHRGEHSCMLVWMATEWVHTNVKTH